jgi:hypothetical protein
VPKLYEVASMVRSKNAGPFELTIEIMFPDSRTYDHVVSSGVVTADTVAERYGIDPSTIRVFNFAPGDAIKVSFPRAIVSGDVDDSDVAGGQQYALVVDMDVPDQATE